jgi:hypothetical protein
MRIISFFKTSFLQATLRFNLAVACCACLTYCLIGLPTLLIDHVYFGIVLCGMSWFVASKLFTEGLSLPKWSYYAFSIPVFIGFSYYFYLHPKSFFLMCTLFLSFISFIFIAPFIGRSSDSDDLWSFHFEVLKNSIYAGAACLILLIGTTLVLLALEYLFSFTPYSGVYIDTFIIIGLFILPVMKLAGIPTRFDDTTQLSTGSILLKLLLYILIPLLLIYGVILHAYSLKIMISQELPRGKVAYLVAGFETLMLATYVLIQRWKIQHSLIRLFHRHIGWFMIIPLMLMAWGLWERISIFGLTESRYCVALLWFWFITSTLVILIRTLNPALWIIGIFSSLFFISSIGPWSIQELPINQQLHKLKTTLSKLRSTEQKSATKEQRITVSSILDYLSSRHRLEDVRSLYLNPTNILPSEKLTLQNVSLELGIQYIEYSARAQTTHISTVRYTTSVTSLPINGYAYIIPNVKFSTYGSLSHSFEIKELGAFTLRYVPTANSFEITQKGINTPVYKTSLPDLIFKLAAGSKDTLQLNTALTTQTNNRLTFQVIFTEIAGTRDTPSSPLHSISDIACTVLIRHTPKK